MSSSPLQELLRKIPSVDEILSWPEVRDLMQPHPRRVVVDATRLVLKRLREQLIHTGLPPAEEESFFSAGLLTSLIREALTRQVQPRLRRVMNATGVVIHTNLGRSPLHPLALQHLMEVSKSYSNLEYDLELGERGSRHDHVEEILRRLTGGESSLVVNNNAGAVLLALNTLAEGREVVVSRGELVEIGGAFRIPDVMRRSGAILREVGTTNRTHLSDYQKAIGPQTALLLKVHTSNFRIMGFTSEVSTQELAGLGKKAGLPVMEDLGSGCLLDLTPFGLDREPTVPETMKTGVDVVTFSGDKLLGGPQAGVIVGEKSILEEMKRNPLTRALRIDKLTLAALESTLLVYLDEKRALAEIPTLRMLTQGSARLRQKGRKLLRRLKGIEGIRAAVREDVSQVGGGSLPLQNLPTTVVTIQPVSLTVHDLETRLRKNEPPILSRISRDTLILDVRTLFDDEIPFVALALRKAVSIPK